MTDTSRRIREVRFRSVRLREGYEMPPVDAFLASLAEAADQEQDLAPLIEAARFPTSRLREGYDMQQVDAFLASLRTGTPGAVGQPAPPTHPSPPYAAPPTGGTGRPEPRAEDDPVVQEVPGLLARLLGRR